jgi:hypothetical protein
MADRRQAVRARGHQGRAPGHRAPVSRQASSDGDRAGGFLGGARSLAVRPRVVAPHARLGLVWAAVTAAAAVAGVVPLGAWLAAVTGLAGMQAARARRRRLHRPSVLGAGLGASAVTLAATAGTGPVAVVAAAVLVAAPLLTVVGGGRGTDAVATTVTALMVGGAGASLVLVRAMGLVPALVLLSYAMAYDASNYVVGSGASSFWEGPASGVAAIGAVTLAVAAVLVPPFRGPSPWLLGGLAAVLAPLGPAVGTALVADPQARVPALRRVDSLLLLAPLWSLAAAFLLDQTG